MLFTFTVVMSGVLCQAYGLVTLLFPKFTVEHYGLEEELKDLDGFHVICGFLGRQLISVGIICYGVAYMLYRAPYCYKRTFAKVGIICETTALIWGLYLSPLISGRINSNGYPSCALFVIFIILWTICVFKNEPCTESCKKPKKVE